MQRPMQRVFHRFSRPVLDSDGRSNGWLSTYSEFTEDRQSQAAAGHTEKMAALGQLVSGSLDETNNPLTTISGYTQLLLGRGLPAACIPDARKLYQEAERARRIVKDLLYFARESKPERVPVDVNETIERTLALRSYELKVADISVNCDLAPDLPRTMADPYQIQQVILNLIINSEQALTEQRGQGNVWIRTSHLTQQLSDPQIAIEFFDDGPGIAPEFTSRIFEPFFTTKAPGIGTGLGLSIAYGIIRQHQGVVTLENRRGEGAKFLIKLPVVPISSETSHDGRVAPLGTFRRTGPKRVLVLEDEPTVSQLIADVLREDQHEVESVSNGQAGLARMSSNTYDLVICDLRMPRLDGRAVYEALVRAGSSIQDRILFITGDTLAPRTFEFFEKNHLRYLAKPFLVEELRWLCIRFSTQKIKALLQPLTTIAGRKAHHADSSREQMESSDANEGASMNNFSTRKSTATATKMRSTPEEIQTELSQSAAGNTAQGGVLLGVADTTLAQRLASELKKSATAIPLTMISTLSQLASATDRVAPEVIFLDSDLLGGLPLCESVRRLAASAPVLLLASLSSQAELAELVAEGNVDYIARVGDFLPIAGALIFRRLRSEAKPTAQSTAMSIIPFASMSELLRHQINNPLTGILGNAELVLAHREHLSQLAIQRLETVVDLAVRLRENIRRLSDDIERSPFV